MKKTSTATSIAAIIIHPIISILILKAFFWLKIVLENDFGESASWGYIFLVLSIWSVIRMALLSVASQKIK